MIFPGPGHLVDSKVQPLVPKHSQRLRRLNRLGDSEMAAVAWWHGVGAPTWRITPLSNQLATPIYEPFRPFGRGNNSSYRMLGYLLTMLANYLLTGMILQAVCQSEPPKYSSFNFCWVENLGQPFMNSWIHSFSIVICYSEMPPKSDARIDDACVISDLLAHRNFYKPTTN